MFERFRRWLKGEFVCVKCGRKWYAEGTLGFGEIICPECYDGEGEWFFPDRSYWLNRLIFGE